MPDIQELFAGRWQVLDRLGKGGHGVVYRVADLRGRASADVIVGMLKAGLQDAVDNMREMELIPAHYAQFMDAIRLTADAHNAPLAAVKELLPFEEGVAAEEKKAIARMKNELDAMASVDHPALLKVLDIHADEIDRFTQGIDRQVVDACNVHRGCALEGSHENGNVAISVHDVCRRGWLHQEA